MGGKAVKILRLACFAPAVPSSVDYNIRVYFVEDNQNALEVSVWIYISVIYPLCEKEP